MPTILDLIHQRRSIRSYQSRPIDPETRDQIIAAAMRAPTAGNMMLYSIIEVADQSLKNRLVKTCDHQPFIAKAPLVLLFVADYQRWSDLFDHFAVDDYCRRVGETRRHPQEGDLMLACCDALIAAQTAVLAAEALGLGSCYIGDIMEGYETHREMFDLPPYVFPVCMLCFGYPKASALERSLTPRFGKAQLVFRDRYRRLDGEELDHLLDGPGRRSPREPARNVGQAYYRLKFAAAFSREMSRSVRAAMRAWCGHQTASSTREKEQMDKHQTTIATYDRCAQGFADKFMESDLYWASLDRFAEGLKPGSRLLDLGCGPGNNLRHLLTRLPDLQITGIDLAPAMLEIARREVPRGEFRVGDIRHLDPAEGPYDAILAAMCLPYLDKAEARDFVIKLGKMLNPEGRLYLSCMEGEKSGYETASFSGDNPIYVHYFTQAEITAWLAETGLHLTEVIRQEYPEPDGSTTIDMIFLCEGGAQA